MKPSAEGQSARGEVRLRDIAAASGYSPATVSWALRGLARVPEATKEKIRAVAEQLGYRPDPKLTELAAHLRSRRLSRSSSTLALITPDPLDLQTTPWPFAHGLVARARELGYNVEVFPMREDEYTVAELNRVLLSRNIQGLIVTSLNAPPVLDGLDWSRFSAVTLSNLLREPRLHRVCSHHFQSLLLACDQLHERGYRRIGLILDTAMDARDNRERHAAFLFHGDTSGANALPPLFEHPLTSDHLERYIRTHRPDCLLYPNREFLNLILRVKRKLASRLPPDFGYAGLHLFPEDT
ncbi:MAG: LacI family DNA-binding transcriptional regulator, partial [Kiritimatiellia bacterium]|nr:LacI family DNA-binding transcriptional regulator [Kiritimatiellia bacterium]